MRRRPLTDAPASSGHSNRSMHVIAHTDVSPVAPRAEKQASLCGSDDWRLPTPPRSIFGQSSTLHDDDSVHDGPAELLAPCDPPMQRRLRAKTTPKTAQGRCGTPLSQSNSSAWRLPTPPRSIFGATTSRGTVRIPIVPGTDERRDDGDTSTRTSPRQNLLGLQLGGTRRRLSHKQSTASSTITGHHTSVTTPERTATGTKRVHHYPSLGPPVRDDHTWHCIICDFTVRANDRRTLSNRRKNHITREHPDMTASSFNRVREPIRPPPLCREVPSPLTLWKCPLCGMRQPRDPTTKCTDPLRKVRRTHVEEAHAHEGYTYADVVRMTQIASAKAMCERQGKQGLYTYVDPTTGKRKRTALGIARSNQRNRERLGKLRTDPDKRDAYLAKMATYKTLNRERLARKQETYRRRILAERDMGPTERNRYERFLRCNREKCKRYKAKRRAAQAAEAAQRT